jgi:hypothetical protein
MPSNWNYVAAGYAITAGALISYYTWVKVRTRRIKRTLSDDRD